MTARVQIQNVPLADLVPYEFNPRDNAKAIDAVAQSIRQFGFLVPIVIDTDGVIVAGHTRHAAMNKLLEETGDYETFGTVSVIVADHLDENQLRAFRLIDNKVSELAVWDFDKLAGEISYLHGSGVDLVSFGWTQQEVDCLTAVVDMDCLTVAETAQQMASAGVDTSLGDQRSGHQRRDGVLRDGTSVRITFGDLAFFVRIEDYRAWMDELMRQNDFDPTAVIEHVAEGMGLLAAKLRRDGMVQEGSVLPEAEETITAAEQTIV